LGWRYTSVPQSTGNALSAPILGFIRQGFLHLIPTSGVKLS